MGRVGSKGVRGEGRHFSNMPTVRKSDGTYHLFDERKLRARVQRLVAPHHGTHVDADLLVSRVGRGLEDGISTADLDDLLAKAADALVVEHPYYGEIAGRVMLTRRRKVAVRLFSTVTAQNAASLDEAYVTFVSENKDFLDAMVEATGLDTDHASIEIYPHLNADSMRTLEKSYYQRGECFETMQARVATAIFMGAGDSLGQIRRCYEMLIGGYYTHATPTLFNAGTRIGQLASCFLLPVREDSIAGMCDTYKQTALMSKSAGGIGLDWGCVRATGTPISGGGLATGVVGALGPFDALARYCDQTRRRKGAIAAYLPDWHADTPALIRVKHPHAPPGMGLEQVFPAVWMHELFWKRVKAGGQWSFMCPRTCPGLSEVYGHEFEELYALYEAQRKFVRQVPAREFLKDLLRTQLESGVPYVLNADLINRCNNQRPRVVTCSNLCAEITEPSTSDEPAMCNLASVNLTRFVREGAFDFEAFGQVVAFVVEALDRVISVTRTFDPCMSARNNEMRPMGIGVQGWADVLHRLRLPWGSDEARRLNANIFSCLYWRAIEASAHLAARLGTYRGRLESDVSRGVFHPDHFEVPPQLTPSVPSPHEVAAIRRLVASVGTRNSLLVALMPTSSTSVILNASPSFEPYYSNMFGRDTGVGSFQVMRAQFVNDLISVDRWTPETRARIVAGGGSLRLVPDLPDWMYKVYKTAHEVGGSMVRRLAAERAPYVDQSQSLNVWTSTVEEGVRQFMAHFPHLKTWAYYTHNLQQVRETAVARETPSASASAASTASTSPPPSIPSPAPACSREPDCEACSA